MQALRELFSRPAGKFVAAAVILAGLGAVVWSLERTLTDDAGAAASRSRLFICAETGKPFRVQLEAGMNFPIESPHSGRRTGYPAELCYWTKDGAPKSEPTPVLLNSMVGKPGATFCPDCGRLVRPHNPVARAASTPPPTRQEYERARSDD